MRRSYLMICSKFLLVMALSSIAICFAHAESGRAAFYSGGRTASGDVGHKFSSRASNPFHAGIRNLMQDA